MWRQRTFTFFEGKSILSLFRGYPKATSSGRDCLLFFYLQTIATRVVFRPSGFTVSRMLNVGLFISE